MSLDKFASADGTPPKASSTPPPPEETNEDLFDFDELAGASAKVAAEMRKELDDALTTVDEAKKDVASTITPAAAPASAAAPAAATPATAAAGAPTPLRPAQPAEAATATPVIAAGTTVVHQKLTMSPAAAMLLAAVVLANAGLMFFALRSVNATKNLVVDVANEVRDTTSDLREESSRRTQLAAFESEPAFGALPEGYRTLQIARERIERGEHARARRMLYGLLAVIDRLETPARQEVEAQAGFLIADSFRAEADGLESARVSPAEAQR